MIKMSLLSATAVTLVIATTSGTAQASTDQRQGASQPTIAANDALLDALPFDNTTDFSNARRGLIAPLPSKPVLAKSKAKIWDSGEFDFVEETATAPDTVNPSLWRQSQLVNIDGLFKVTDGIYQVRNQDLSNMTIIEGDEGITIVDPLISAETAKQALDLYFRNEGKKPVKAVIYSHSHVDHFGGVRGIVDERDVENGSVKIYAPQGFTEAAISENVMAGNAMSRRASYMYGALLPADARGQVGAGLGMTTSNGGEVTLIPPTDIITRTGQTEVIDGLTYEFLMAPNTEAPAEMLWYIKEKKTIDAAEDITHTLHNTYSLRGAKVRDPLAWSKAINEAIDMWGENAEILIAQHHWPIWGNSDIDALMTKQRDLYRFINDQTLHLANQGYTMREIAEQIELPPALDRFWANRGYYGTLYHDVAATYNYYLGWFDGNPATLHELPPVDAAKKYVDFMGGAEAVLAKAQTSYDEGDYRWVAEVVNNVVFADPANKKARQLEADALEQLGYQAESGPWRNFYLTGASELRNGVQKLPAANSVSADMIEVMEPGMFFDYIGVLLDAHKAGNESIRLNVSFTDGSGDYLLDLSNGTLNHTTDATAPDADATINLSHATLVNLVLKKETINAAQQNGELTIDGNRDKLQELLSFLERPEFWFNIATP